MTPGITRRCTLVCMCKWCSSPTHWVVFFDCIWKPACSLARLGGIHTWDCEQSSSQWLISAQSTSNDSSVLTCWATIWKSFRAWKSNKLDIYLSGRVFSKYKHDHVKILWKSLRQIVKLCEGDSFIPRPLLPCSFHPDKVSYDSETAHVQLQLLIKHQPLWTSCLLLLLKGDNRLQTRLIYGVGLPYITHLVALQTRNTM